MSKWIGIFYRGAIARYAIVEGDTRNEAEAELRSRFGNETSEREMADWCADLQRVE